MSETMKVIKNNEFFSKDGTYVIMLCDLIRLRKDGADFDVEWILSEYESGSFLEDRYYALIKKGWQATKFILLEGQP